MHRIVQVDRIYDIAFSHLIKNNKNDNDNNNTFIKIFSTTTTTTTMMMMLKKNKSNSSFDGAATSSTNGSNNGNHHVSMAIQMYMNCTRWKCDWKVTTFRWIFPWRIFNFLPELNWIKKKSKFFPSYFFCVLVKPISNVENWFRFVWEFVSQNQEIKAAGFFFFLFHRFGLQWKFYSLLWFFFIGYSNNFSIC